MGSPLLKINSCSIQFGGLSALSDLNFEMNAGEILGVIGPNGAGKTTFFNLLTGVYVPSKGELYFENQKINGWAPHKICHAGIARTFQNIRLFNALSVEDNVMVAFHHHLQSSLWDSIFRTHRFKAEQQKILKSTQELLSFFSLEEISQVTAKNLSYGDQRRLEIVRALATQPKLLLLDEPAAGMNPVEKSRLMDLIQKIKKRFGLSIILIEHDMHVVMNLCPHILVLDYGEIIARGSPVEIQKNPKVIEAYLGVQA